MNTHHIPEIDAFSRDVNNNCSCCFSRQRRLFNATLVAAGAFATAPAFARNGVDVGKRSTFTKLVPASKVEQAAQLQYRKMLQQAGKQRALAPKNHPQVLRLRAIANRVVPFSSEWNKRARGWEWEVNVFGGKQINAFCMPGGKIAFFHGILAQLMLNDDEVAMVMGHEMAHALREHARERMGKTVATRGLIELGSALLGLGSGGRYLADLGGQLLTLKFAAKTSPKPTWSVWNSRHAPATTRAPE